MSKCKTGLTLLFLMTFAAGCATTEPTVRTETVYEKPPKSLFPVCKTPDHVTETNGDLARAYNDMRSALEECRSGMEAVKEWPDVDEVQ